MRAVIQRVEKAKVLTDENTVGEISKGLLVFIAVHINDTEEHILKMSEKILNLRIFENDKNKLGLSVRDIFGEILVVSQFTLYADTKKGNRPSFLESAKPEKALNFYNQFIKKLELSGLNIQSGKFGALMKVELINDGPITILLDIN